MRKKSSVLILIIISILILQHCSNSTSPEDGGSVNNDNPNQVFKEIGPEGGKITSNDGKLTLEIPAGALGNMEKITIEEISPDKLNSAFDSINVERAWELGPDGLEFSMPANVTITTDQNPVSGDSISVQPQVAFTSDSEQITPLDSMEVIANVDHQVVQLQAMLSHFSFIVLEQVIVETSSGDALDFFKIENVPFERIVNDPWEISWEIQDYTDGRFTFPNFKEILFDRSVQPVALADPSVSDRIPVTNKNEFFIDAFRWNGSVEYTCTEPGTGTFSMVSIWQNASLYFLEFVQRIRVEQEIKCLPVSKKSLTVNFTGNGTGNVTSSPEGIDCNTSDVSCTHEFEEGTSIELTATATGNSRFCGWDTGVDTEENPVVIVELDRNAEIEVCFEEQESQTADLSINLTGPETPVNPGEESNLEVTVKNNGPDDLPAGEISIILEFSEELDYSIPEDDTVQCEESENQLTCVPESDDPFSAKSEITFVTQFRCQSSSDPCAITGEVQSSSANDPNADNNTDQEEITIEEEDNSVNPEDIEGDWTYTLTVEESSCYAEDLTPDAEISLIDEGNGTLEIAFDLILDPKVTGNVEQNGSFSGETPWIHTQDDLDYKFILEGTFAKNNQDFTFDGTMLNEIRDSETHENICSRTYNTEGEKTGE